MRAELKILPGTGRGIAAEGGGGGGSPHLHRLGPAPSTKPLRVLVPLPVNGEDF
jgi:hypothetical protein